MAIAIIHAWMRQLHFSFIKLVSSLQTSLYPSVQKATFKYSFIFSEVHARFAIFIQDSNFKLMNFSYEDLKVI